MKLIRKPAGTWVIIAGTLFGISLILIGSATHTTNSPPVLGLYRFAPNPPLSLQDNHFSCLESLAKTHGRRFAVLRGPDWTLESAIEPECFPAREVVLSFEEGRNFLSHPLIRHIRFWIRRNGEKFYVKIIESSGIKESDDSALDLVNNHKCKTQSTENCNVQSGRIIVNM